MVFHQISSKNLDFLRTWNASLDDKRKRESDEVEKKKRRNPAYLHDCMGDKLTNRNKGYGEFSQT